MQLDWAVANAHEEGVMDAIRAVCTPEWTSYTQTRAWADTQYVQAIRLVGESDRDVMHLSFDRAEDVEPTLALLAEEGVYLNPYFPYKDEFDEPVDWG